MAKINVTIIAILIAGCSTTESQDFHRTADLIEARDSFNNGKEACRKSGKTAFVSAYPSRIKRERSDEHDYKFAYCD